MIKSTFEDLDELELGLLRMSVGYKGHKKNRPYSPVEVATIIDRAHVAGTSLEDCAIKLKLDGTSQVRRFLSILKLPQDLQDLVRWGAGSGLIGFSAGYELVRLESEDDLRSVAMSILENGLNSKEVRQVVQLRNRSSKSIEECLNEILGMRPSIQRKYIFIGSIFNPNTQKMIAGLTQERKNQVLNAALQGHNLSVTSCSLGNHFFTLVGDNEFHETQKRTGKERLETMIVNGIVKVLEND